MRWCIELPSIWGHFIHKTEIPTALLPYKLHRWFLKVPKPLLVIKQSQAIGIRWHKTHSDFQGQLCKSKWKLTTSGSLIQQDIQHEQNLCTSACIQVDCSKDRKQRTTQTVSCFLFWVSRKKLLWSILHPPSTHPQGKQSLVLAIFVLLAERTAERAK